MRKSKLSTQILWVGLITILLTILATMILPLVRERSLRRLRAARERAGVAE